MRRQTNNSRSPVKTIVLVATPGTRLIDVAGPADVFSLATEVVKGQPGRLAGYKLVVASSVKSKHVESKSGVKITCDISVADIDFKVDTFMICGGGLSTIDIIPPSFYTWLKAQAQAIRRVASVCVGAFVLARAKLLDGKRATTHWEYCNKLQSDYPLISVDNTPFFVHDGKIYTSGGMTSGMDLALALVEEDFGKEAALLVARRMVLHLKRPGSQSQFSNLLPAYEQKSPLARTVRNWVLEHLNEEISVDLMAESANMSPRNFARVFLKETSHTPAKFVEKLRVEIARQYLEDSALSIDQIAERCGLGGPVSMRRTFLRHLQISPSEYRQAFRTSLTPSEVS